MPSFDPDFWSVHFRRVFIPELRAVERAVVERVLPAFDGLEQEAEAFALEEYERLGSLSPADSVDLADLAEMAQEAGIGKYEELTGVRQAIVNLCTAALFHLVEQQLLVFFRRQILRSDEEQDSALYTWGEIHRRFEEMGVTLKGLAAWPLLRELECVANTVKHGDGRSARELRAIRPEIFVPEVFRGDAMMGRPAPLLGTPLSGDGVYITPSDFQRYADAAVAFWDDLGDAILSKP